jgi:hypothetical protein
MEPFPIVDNNINERGIGKVVEKESQGECAALLTKAAYSIWKSILPNCAVLDSTSLYNIYI